MKCLRQQLTVNITSVITNDSGTNLHLFNLSFVCQFENRIKDMHRPVTTESFHLNFSVLFDQPQTFENFYLSELKNCETTSIYNYFTIFLFVKSPPRMLQTFICHFPSMSRIKLGETFNLN